MPQPLRTPSPPPIGPASVLIIDDDDDVRHLLNACVTGHPGLTVVAEAVDGLDGVTKAAEHQPDIVLLDILMPRQDGHRALGRILSVSRSSMVVVVSGLPRDEVAPRAMAAGAFAWIDKIDVGSGLPLRLIDLHREFGRALTGETVIVNLAIAE